jgi:hypothetical protein
MSPSPQPESLTSPNQQIPTPSTRWRETYLGGSEIAEAEIVRRFMEEINAVQAQNKAHGGLPAPDRAFHAKIHAGIVNAKFVISSNLPEEFRVGFFEPNKSYDAIVRFSNGSGVPQDDDKRDLRGIAIRVLEKEGTAHDFLMTNAPASHARDATQFMAFAKAGAGSKLMLLPKLIWAIGFFETIRMLRTVIRQTSRPVGSLTTEQFFSRAPYAFGTHAVKFMLDPQKSDEANSISGPDRLRIDLAARLKERSIHYDFKVQDWVDEKTTPIEDGVIQWNSPAQAIAQLVIPKQDLASKEARDSEKSVNNLEFSPWNTTTVFRPLGSLNRARRLVYRSSVGLRTGRESYEQLGILRKIFYALLVPFFRCLNFVVPWHKLPPYLGAMNLLAFRTVLRKQNLYDTDDPHARLQPRESEVDPKWVRYRHPDGKFDDLTYPNMGCAGARFGRNVPRKYTYPDLARLHAPSPREISRKLLRRREFIPAETLNLLAAAWIQFQVHDWFMHAGPDTDNPDQLKLERDDDWGKPAMEIRRSTPDRQSNEEQSDGSPPAYRNEESHWWDASQIYGNDPETESKLRTHELGHLRLNEEDHLLLIDPETKLPITGFTNNWWIGLYLFHALFAQEHNTICGQLHLQNPYWNDEELFQTARLINCALMAKIHTVEWTPAILAHPTLEVAMNANWWGLATEKIHKLFGRLSESETISGIPGSPVDHQQIPFSLTEEFVAVYRLHPLIPDEIQLFQAETGQAIPNGLFPIADLAFTKAQDVFVNKTASLPDVLYSFGISNPGAITLHNYPDFLRDLELPTPDGRKIDRRIDLATTDIYRDRERGIPRYNQFRKLLHRPPIKSFDELTGNNHVLAQEIREIYGTDKSGRDCVELLDPMVGMFAEPLPKGFGFSDTAFRVFILMASRRLKSDRFFTTDFTPEVYTQFGLDWISSNTFSSILIRHYPELTPALRGIKNPFAPWRPIAS